MLCTLSQRLSPRVLRAPRRLDAAARELDEYFSRQRRVFDLPLDLSLSKGFRQLVQRHLPEIGYGQTRTYRQVAELVGNPRGGPGRRHRLRHEPAAGRRALPPGAAGRRDTRRLRRRPRRQAGAAQLGGSGVSSARSVSSSTTRMNYVLLGADGRPYRSDVKGQWGGHRGARIYGRLDCPSALRAIARGGYARHRVFLRRGDRHRRWLPSAAPAAPIATRHGRLIRWPVASRIDAAKAATPGGSSGDAVISSPGGAAMRRGGAGLRHGAD